MSYEFQEKDLYGLAQKIGADTKQKGDELFFRWCPYCHGDGHDKETFSVNLRTGLFKCFRSGCAKQGHFVQLARDFGYPLDMGDTPRKYRELPQRPLKIKESAVDYLATRGISRMIVERFHISARKDNEKILVFPFYDENSVLRFVKYRKTDFDKARDKNKEWCEADTMPILFGMDQCEGFDYLVITEGQIDSLSVAEAGVLNAVSVPNGAKGFTWVENCWDWISKFSEVIVFGDCEKGKITLVEELSRRLTCKLRVVRKEDYLGEKDANAILQKYGAEAIRQAVTNAEVLPVNHVKRLAEVENVDLNTLPKITTGISSLDRLIGGLFFGQVILLTGKRGEGKSTFMGMINAEAINQGYKTFTYSGELPDYHFKRWLDLQIAGPHNVVTTYNQFSDPEYSLSDEVVQKINKWYFDQAFLYDNNSIDGDEYESLLDTVEKSIQRYGINLVCIDNLMTAINISNAENQYIQQSQFVRSLKKIAVKYNVVVVLVAHPRKTQGKVSDNDSVSGSSDITNRVDLVMSYAKNPDDESPGGKIFVMKNRLSGKLALKDNAIQVAYDSVSKRIYSPSAGPNVKYFWEIPQKEYGPLDDLPF
ncbi:MAG: AAA family ATPase [Lachnospiraceae bacterium]